MELRGGEGDLGRFGAAWGGGGCGGGGAAESRRCGWGFM